MKKIEEIQKEILALSKSVIELEKSHLKKDIALRKRLRGRILQLKEYVLYL